MANIKKSRFRNFKHPVVGILIHPQFDNDIDRFGSNLCLLRGLKPVVFLGRCLGALSRTDILEKNDERKYRVLNVASLISTIITIFLFMNAILLTRLNLEKFERDKTTLVKLEGFNHAGYAASMFIIYLYQLFYSKRVRDIVRSFLIVNQASHLPSFTGRRGISRYPIFCWIILGFCVSLGILENIVFDWQSLRRGVVRGNRTSTILELYYSQNFNHWHVIMPEYSAPPTFVLTALVKLATWGWVYMDVICVLFCRALWEKLWIIGENLRWSPFTNNIYEHDEVTDILGIPLPHRASQKDTDIFKDEYVMVTDLVEQVQQYISPLIVMCYTGNMYILIVMLFNWIGPFSTEEVSREKTIHVCFAFFQFLFRVGIITYFAGEVHQKCLDIRRSIQMCPNSMYTTSLERLERILISNPAGICLFRSFIITRKFFVSIISFIFTTEIVLLQSYSGYYNF